MRKNPKWISQALEMIEMKVDDKGFLRYASMNLSVYVAYNSNKLVVTWMIW